jgi:outer membrane receptor protein involved in Fe transport
LDGSLYGGAYARYPQRGNPDLKEERIREYEVGLDLGFFENRLSLTTTYYNRLTKDALLSQPLAPSTGFTSELQNLAEISNKGLEMDAKYLVLDYPDFQWSVSANFSMNRNIVEKLPGVNSVQLNGFYPSTRVVEGEPFGVLWGPLPLRDDEGVVYDRFGYPLLDPEQGIIGDPNPKWRGGLSTLISWKGLTLTALLETFQGANMYAGTYTFLNLYGMTQETATESVSPPGGFTNVQGIYYPEGTVFRGTIKDFGAGPVPLDSYWYTSENRFLNSTTIQDGSWTRIRELSLFYSFSSKFCERIGLRNFELGITGRNLFLWTDFIGNDPDLNLFGASKGRGYDYFTNPGSKGYMFTLKVGL